VYPSRAERPFSPGYAPLSHFLQTIGGPCRDVLCRLFEFFLRCFYARSPTCDVADLDPLIGRGQCALLPCPPLQTHNDFRYYLCSFFFRYLSWHSETLGLTMWSISFSFLPPEQTFSVVSGFPYGIVTFICRGLFPPLLIFFTTESALVSLLLPIGVILIGFQTTAGYLTQSTRYSLRSPPFAGNPFFVRSVDWTRFPQEQSPPPHPLYGWLLCVLGGGFPFLA